MHISRHIVQELVYEFGTPEVERWDVPLTEAEFREVSRYRKHGRAHDVSLAILDRDQIAVVRKASDPRDVFRLPTGGIHPEESFLDGTSRSALEETGLQIHVKDYLLQVHADFSFGGERSRWASHVMLADAEDGSIGPRETDSVEVAQWVPLATLVATINPTLEASGLGELLYRARIHQRLTEILSERGS